MTTVEKKTPDQLPRCCMHWPRRLLRFEHRVRGQRANSTRILLSLGWALFLCACDGPAARKNFAKCQLSFPGKSVLDDIEAYKIYMRTCMQAGGFALDVRLDANCAGTNIPEMQAICYRPDNWFAERVANFNAPPR
jgi:hypothetical protein